MVGRNALPVPATHPSPTVFEQMDSRVCGHDTICVAPGRKHTPKWVGTAASTSGSAHRQGTKPSRLSTTFTSGSPARKRLKFSRNTFAIATVSPW